jgi:membrane-bound ClpP family serine protease
MEGVLAENMLIVSYVRAVARAEGHDETGAVLMALETIRAHNGEAAADSVAKAQGLDLDALLDQQREDAEQAERERTFEADVPWGSP